MSYNTLLKNGKLITYREEFPGWFVEVWNYESNNYECHWLPGNASPLPTTIKKI